jgi:DNA polymerase III delta prime subunit
LIRPIAFAQTNFVKVLEVKLASLGFRDAKVWSQKLVDFVTSAVRVCRPLLKTAQALCHMLTIADDGHAILSRLRMSNQAPISLATAAIYYFRGILDAARQKLLLSLAYSSFKLASSLADFTTQVAQIHAVSIDETLRKYLNDALASMKVDLPAAYLIKEAIILYHLLETQSCVIVAGPPYSGKTTVLKLLSRALENETLQAMPNCTLKPMAIERLFVASEPLSRILGTLYNDASLGQTWQYGQLQAVLWSLAQREKNHMGVLVFDGPLLPDFVQFLGEFIGCAGEGRWSLTSLDSYKFHSCRIIIETGSLDNVDPTLFSKSGILTLMNVQSKTRLFRCPVAELIHPTLPFARGVEMSNQAGQGESLSCLRSLFCQMTSQVIKRVCLTKNIIAQSDSHSRIENGHILLAELMPTMACRLALHMINTAIIDRTNDKQMRMVMGVALFQVFSNVLDPKEVPGFDTWIRSAFLIDVPPDWSGYTVPEVFSTMFKRPSLLAMRFFRGKFIPLDIARLAEKPITFLPGENRSMSMNDVIVMHPQMLRAAEVASGFIAMHQNLIVHGPPDSGKTALLDFLLHNNEALTAVYIPSSKYHTGQTLIDLISVHTNLISRFRIPSSQVRQFALVFDNVETSHCGIIEFIRMLVSIQQIPSFSTGDPKNFEWIPMSNFMIIITTRSYPSLPLRLLRHFALIQLSTISQVPSNFIALQTMVASGFPIEHASELIKLASTMFRQVPTGFCDSYLRKMMFLLSQLRSKDDISLTSSIVIWLLY